MLTYQYPSPLRYLQESKVKTAMVVMPERKDARSHSELAFSHHITFTLVYPSDLLTFSAIRVKDS